MALSFLVVLGCYPAPLPGSLAMIRSAGTQPLQILAGDQPELLHEGLDESSERTSVQWASSH